LYIIANQYVFTLRKNTVPPMAAGSVIAFPSKVKAGLLSTRV